MATEKQVVEVEQTDWERAQAMLAQQEEKDKLENIHTTMKENEEMMAQKLDEFIQRYLETCRDLGEDHFLAQYLETFLEIFGECFEMLQMQNTMVSVASTVALMNRTIKEVNETMAKVNKQMVMAPKDQRSVRKNMSKNIKNMMKMRKSMIKQMGMLRGKVPNMMTKVKGNARTTQMPKCVTDRLSKYRGESGGSAGTSSGASVSGTSGSSGSRGSGGTGTDGSAGGLDFLN